MELLIDIISYLHPIDYYALRLAGSCRTLEVLRSNFSFLRFEEYVRVLEEEIPRRWYRTVSAALELGAARGQVALVVALMERASPDYQPKGVNVPNLIYHRDCRLRKHKHMYRSRSLFTPSRDTRDAFLWAAEYGQDDILGYLMRIGADPQLSPWCAHRSTGVSKLKLSGTALHLAAAKGHVSMVRLLLLTELGDDGGMHDAFKTAAQSGQDNMLRAFLERGIDFKKLPYKCTRAVALAAQQNHMSTMRLLVSAGAPLNTALASTHMTALHYTSSRGNEEETRFLLNNGADIALRQHQTLNSLDLALANGHEKMAKLLNYRRGRANLGVQNLTISLTAAQGYEACLSIALKCKDLVGGGYIDGTKVVGFLRTYTRYPMAFGRGHFPPLHEAAAARNLSIISLLLQHRAWVDGCAQGQLTPLHCVALSDPPDAEAVPIAKFLIRVRASINKKDDLGFTPLHIAAQRGNHELVKHLASYPRAEVNARDKNQRTPLHLAVANVCMPAINALLDAGAGINLRDRDGQTALHFAAYSSDLEVYHALIDRGANTTLLNIAGRTAAKEHLYVGEARDPPERLRPLPRREPTAEAPPVRCYPFGEILDLQSLWTDQ